MKKNKIRLHKNDFDKIYNERNISHSRYVKLYTAFNSYEHFRIAFAINRKQAGAVERNKIKRRIKNIINKIEINRNIDCIIHIKPMIKKASFIDIEKDIISIIENIPEKIAK
ncbi:MAG: RNase P protein component [Chloroflexi bacterium]|jgi:ribonuclease P protein component|nr:MAG: RNase P protein component [Chloroflexota bacterium]|tara:strand:+ start:966 stop:1301 length:336 start_codon:yes stop_codon:yes gene_type:complete